MTEKMNASMPIDNNLGPTILGISWLTTALACLTVSVRDYTRFKNKASGWDDYLINAAMAVSIYGSVLNTLQVKYGFGRHIEYVLPEVSKITMYTTLVELQNGIGTFLVKASVCLFVLRLLKGTHPKIRWLIWITLVFLLAITVATVMVIGLGCIPFQKTWHPKMRGSCTSKSVQTQLIRILGIIGTITDFVCVIIPTLIIQSLQIDKRTKIAMIVVISLGFIISACGIGKTVTVEMVSEDFTWDYAPTEIWALLEENLGVTVASLPILRPYLAILAGTIKTLTNVPSRLRPASKRRDMPSKVFDGQESTVSEESAGCGVIPLHKVAINENGIRKETQIEVQHSL